MYELALVKLIASRLNEERLRIQVVAGPRFGNEGVQGQVCPCKAISDK